MKTVLEEKISKLRVIQNGKYNEEKKRLDLELINLKKVHNDKILEIKQNNHIEVEQLRTSHKNTIDNARDRFIKEKMKWQTYDD